MSLQLYNTLTRQKQEFVPLDPDNVRMYVCGPTVYDFAHIGNARPLIVFDVLYRLLRHLYGAEHVTYVRNITDVDDKINARAAERGISIRQLTEETNAAFQADAAALGCLEPNVQPRATEHIHAMIALIERLLLARHAYVAEGHVLFDVPSMPDYGKLSRRPLDEMVAGARVEVAPYKKSPMDFVLWKPSAPNEPGWESPWGYGRPGWHLECSAMSWEYLGEVFDVHGGGIDLVFPHHENEIAQTCSAFGHQTMANYWLHNGFLQVEGQKMSKSLGNFITIRQALKDWPGEVVRFNMLKAHYRQPIDWTLTSLNESQRELDKFYPLAKQFAVSAATLAPEFLLALEDDLNTPEAITVLRRLYREAQEGDVALAGTRFASCGHFIGLFQSELGDWNPAPILFDKRQVENLIEARLAARRDRNWAESDRIRDELIGLGVALKDNKDGTTSWEVKR
ncbi:MAG: cysteine--tRNA ligase [Methylovirgula sp.]